MDDVIKALLNGPDEITNNAFDDGKRTDHIVYSSLLASCSK